LKDKVLLTCIAGPDCLADMSERRSGEGSGEEAIFFSRLTPLMAAAPPKPYLRVQNDKASYAGYVSLKVN